MEVTLLGTGDTTGTPTPDCECGTCERARELGVERSRFSVHLTNEVTDQSLLIDASPDFRHQFLTQEVPLPDAMVISHIHFDHLDGLGNAYRLFEDLPVHAANEIDPVTDESVADTIRDKYDYLDRITVRDHAPFERFRTCGFDVTLVPVDHPPLYCYGLVIEEGETKLSLTGDTSYDVPDRSKEALSDPDLLLADAIVPASRCEGHPIGGRHHDSEGVPRTFGTKHMTREGALDLAEELNAERTRLVHLAHFYPPEEAFAEPLAVDGERYSL
ncbi:MBL fold metallo-hydrolase [Halalkalicoccus jeotgali]|uniref:ATP-binding protein n=1 Tax=Halalkalicoccus jeotgali (strain DSM 18796 / CECT 7217 / JCM 14584 / KCTC 4019 / B3) TaxID=795797 RepID=D8J878_HALJB|nr:MBL fold metallo-hydrolase [Halalkalicoccus jeotgali]ADJ14191.1 ATP-binding protein [Halalkalicoccus jeotgali B3]ELY34627.1 ATP-binding protein [Halalkalicoccus jeotgali B3]